MWGAFVVAVTCAASASDPACDAGQWSMASLCDKIHGAWAGTLIGGLEGLPHEMKYIDAPRETLPEFNLSITGGARSDDDNDFELMHLHYMDQLQLLKIPYPEIVDIWKENINEGVWLANKRARELMDEGFVPPETADPQHNPIAAYNISGQFAVEMYGAIAAGNPALAAELGEHYGAVAVSGEPLQAARYWTALVSLAARNSGSIEDVLVAALDFVDAQSAQAQVVRDAIGLYHAFPKDWKAARQAINDVWRIENGWNANSTPSNAGLIVLALLYGNDDFYTTLQYAMAMGFDADCNAATAGTVLGMRHGYETLSSRHHFHIGNHYRNATRPGLPSEMTISEQVDLFMRVAAAARAGSETHALYRDTSAPLETRVRDLVARMTLEEKIAQLHEQRKQLEIVDGSATAESLEASFGGLSYGTISGPFGDPAETIAIHNRDAQAYARSHTRLGIPFLTVNETLHGGLSIGTTIYPQTMAQGATWNPDLIRDMAAAIAAEVRSLGVVQALAPMATLARDPRWGRVEECFGECPYLVSRFVVAYIEGMQGDLTQGLGADKMLCMSKVMAAYEMPRAGINIAGTSMGERELRSIYLVPHEAAVREASVASIMPSYNCTDGVPAHANRWLLTELLRNEWGFDGYIYADWGGVGFNHSLHKVAPTRSEAAVMALRAGVDLEAPTNECYTFLAGAVAAGDLDIEIINGAVTNVLRTKFRAGLFDGADAAPPVDELHQHMHTPDQVALARRVAEESVVLLKNDGPLLPLDPLDTPSIAVIGPNADQVQFGDYSATKDNAMGVTILEAIHELANVSGMRVRYARGCDWIGSDTTGFDEAVHAAQASSVAIVVVGDTSMNIGGGLPGGDTDRSLGMLATVGEGYDRAELTLSGVQEDLIRAVHATGIPTIVILVHGRPFAIPWVKEHIPAILDAYYPGEEGGHAIADILFGKVNPSGRLPISVPQSVGHIPTTYDAEPADRGFYRKPGTPDQPGRDYVFSSTDPLWPFGYGLSYTTFEYRDLRIDASPVDAGGVVEFSVELTNTGRRRGSEVVQVYYRDVYSTTVTPRMRLVRFQKIRLDPGESRSLAFSIPCGELALWNTAMQRVVEPGEFELMIGASAEDIRLTATFHVID